MINDRTGRGNWIIPLGAIALAAVAGVVAAVMQTSSAAPELHVLERAVVGPADADGGVDSLVATNVIDDAVTFPEYLADLPGAPVDIEVNRDNGDLWILVIPADGYNVLLKNPAGTTDLISYRLPERGVAPANSAMALTDTGNPVVVLGDKVLFVDPESEQYSEWTLSPDASGSVLITGLDVVDGSAILTRWDSEYLSEVSLSTGETKEIKLPQGFEIVDQLVAQGKWVWLIKRADSEGGAPAGIGVLDRMTGDFDAVTRKPFAADLLGNRLIAAAWAPLGLVSIDESDSTEISVDGAGMDFLSRLGPDGVLVADSDRRSVWITAASASAIGRIELDTGRSHVYELPIYEIEGARVFCPPPEDDSNEGASACPGSFEMYTHVAAATVTPVGGVYFADTTMNRIGLISPQ